MNLPMEYKCFESFIYKIVISFKFKFTLSFF